MKSWKTVVAWLKERRRKIVEIGTGMTLYETFNWFANNPLYIAALAQFGLVGGGTIMFAFSLVQNIVLLYIYDRMKIDWVGAGYLQEVQQQEKRNRVERILVWALKEEAHSKGHLIAQAVVFVLFSMFVDPFIVSVHYRRSQFKGVSRRDLGILITSVLIGNVYWTLRTGLLVIAAKMVWKWWTQ